MTEKKFCSNCGRELRSYSSRCPQCNARIVSSSYSNFYSNRNPHSFCSNCGKELGSFDRTCSRCRTKVASNCEIDSNTKMFCTNCGRELRVNSIRCPFCNAKIDNKENSLFYRNDKKRPHIFCSKCGVRLGSYSSSCHRCGAKVISNCYIEEDKSYTNSLFGVNLGNNKNNVKQNNGKKPQSDSWLWLKLILLGAACKKIGGEDDKKNKENTVNNETPVSNAPVNSVPASSTPVSNAPANSTPVSSTPVNNAPASSTPVSSTPVNNAPASSTPVSSTPVNSAPASSTPVNTAPANNIQASFPDLKNEPKKDSNKKFCGCGCGCITWACILSYIGFFFILALFISGDKQFIEKSCPELIESLDGDLNEREVEGKYVKWEGTIYKNFSSISPKYLDVQIKCSKKDSPFDLKVNFKRSNAKEISKYQQGSKIKFEAKINRYYKDDGYIFLSKGKILNENDMKEESNKQKSNENSDKSSSKTNLTNLDTEDLR